MAFIVKGEASHVTAEQAKDYIAGYTILNDVSAQELQAREIKESYPLFRCKSLQTFTPMGPWVATVDEIGIEPELEMTLRVNDEIRVLTNTRGLTFGIARLMEFISGYVLLCPGDVITTGCPKAAGAIHSGGRCLAGDREYRRSAEFSRGWKGALPGMIPLRVALIGCGFIGRRHLENIAARTDVLLEATVDVREEAARAFCCEFRGRYFTTRPEQVFEDRTIDAVLICTHHDSHTKLALDAAAHGKHVLVEKPMALTVEECRQISTAADQAGITLTVNFKFRFAPAVLKVKEFIQSPLAIHGQLAMEKMPDGIWVRDPVRGGGLILATACHSLDMICWLGGSEPVRVYAESIPPLPEQGCNVTAVTATVRLANGAIASLLLAEAGENGYAAKWLHEVFGGRPLRRALRSLSPGTFLGCDAALISLPRLSVARPRNISPLQDFGGLDPHWDRRRWKAADGLRATRLAQGLS